MLISNFLFYIAFSVSLLFALNGDSEKKPNCIAIGSMIEKEQKLLCDNFTKSNKEKKQRVLIIEIKSIKIKCDN